MYIEYYKDTYTEADLPRYCCGLVKRVELNIRGYWVENSILRISMVPWHDKRQNCKKSDDYQSKFDHVWPCYQWSCNNLLSFRGPNGDMKTRKAPYIPCDGKGLFSRGQHDAKQVDGPILGLTTIDNP